MGDSTQVNDPEEWMFLSDAVEHFMVASSELFPLDRNPFSGSPQNADDELSGSIVRSYALHECERLIDRSYWGVLTNAGVFMPAGDRDAIRHGLFDLNLGVLGRRHDLADSLTSIFTGIPRETLTREAYLPATLERYRDRPVVLHAAAWRDVVRAWRAEENATRQQHHGRLVDFDEVSDDYLGGLITRSFENAVRGHLAPSRDRMCEAFMAIAAAKSLSRKRFYRVWKLFGTRPENRHLRMSSPGTKAGMKPAK